LIEHFFKHPLLLKFLMMFFDENIASPIATLKKMSFGATYSIFIGAHSHKTVPISKTDSRLV